MGREGASWKRWGGGVSFLIPALLFNLQNYKVDTDVQGKTVKSLHILGHCIVGVRSSAA